MPYLQEAIESVLSQTYDNIELIVLDDGSTDETLSFLQHYEGRFYFESHKNIGQAATLNKGWAICNGEIIAYLSADDVLLPDAVKIAVQTLTTHPNAVLCYPDNYLIDANGKRIRLFKTPRYNHDDMVTNIVCPVAVGGFFRKSAFDNTAGWNAAYKQFPDYEFFLRLSQFGTFIHIDIPLGLHRIHAESASFAKMSPERADEIVHIMTDHLRDAKNRFEKKKALGRAYLIAARNHCRASRYARACQLFLTSIKCWPKSLLSLDTYHILFNAIANRSLHKGLQALRKLTLRITLCKAWFHKKQV